MQASVLPVPQAALRELPPRIRRKRRKCKSLQVGRSSSLAVVTRRSQNLVLSLVCSRSYFFFFSSYFIFLSSGRVLLFHWLFLSCFASSAVFWEADRGLVPSPIRRACLCLRMWRRAGFFASCLPVFTKAVCFASCGAGLRFYSRRLR